MTGASVGERKIGGMTTNDRRLFASASADQRCRALIDWAWPDVMTPATRTFAETSMGYHVNLRRRIQKLRPNMHGFFEGTGMLSGYELRVLSDAQVASVDASLDRLDLALGALD